MPEFGLICCHDIIHLLNKEADQIMINTERYLVIKSTENEPLILIGDGMEKTDDLDSAIEDCKSFLEKTELSTAGIYDLQKMKFIKLWVKPVHSKLMPTR